MVRMQEVPRKFSKDPVGEVFGATVRRLRESRAWTQEQLAEQAEMSATYLGFIERGENVPTLTIIFRLARALGVSAAALIADAERA
jgi:transcriptional regulator with XRE-family HTH domain